MKKLAVKKGIDCMACLSCVRACSEAFYKVFDEAKSCIRPEVEAAGLMIQLMSAREADGIAAHNSAAMVSIRFFIWRYPWAYRLF